MKTQGPDRQLTESMPRMRSLSYMHIPESPTPTEVIKDQDIGSSMYNAGKSPVDVMCFSSAKKRMCKGEYELEINCKGL